MGWPLSPEGLENLLVRWHKEHGDKLPPLYITENGAAFDGEDDLATAVNDQRRVDFYAGYRFSYTGLDFTVQGLAYTFPGEDKDSTDGYDPVGIDGDSVEINFGVSHTFEAQLSPTVGFNYYFSPNFYGEDGAGHAFQFNGGLTLPMDIGAYVMGGYQTVKGDKYSGALGGYNYAYYQAGTNYMLKGFKLDVSWTGTDMDESLKDFYPNTSPDNFRTLIQGTFLLTVSRTF
jgi:hypothetical protein